MTTILIVRAISKHFLFAFVEPYGDSVESRECPCAAAAAAAAGAELLAEIRLHGGASHNQLGSFTNEGGGERASR